MHCFCCVADDFLRRDDKIFLIVVIRLEKKKMETRVITLHNMDVIYYPAGLYEIVMSDGSDLFAALGDPKFEMRPLCRADYDIVYPVLRKTTSERVQVMLLSDKKFRKHAFKGQYCMDIVDRIAVELHDDDAGHRFRVLIDEEFFRRLTPRYFVKLITKLAATVEVDYKPVHADHHCSFSGNACQRPRPTPARTYRDQPEW